MALTNTLSLHFCKHRKEALMEASYIKQVDHFIDKHYECFNYDTWLQMPIAHWVILLHSVFDGLIGSSTLSALYIL